MFKRIMPLIGIQMTDEEIDQLYHKADVDGPESHCTFRLIKFPDFSLCFLYFCLGSGEIEFEEFVFLIRNLNPRASAGQLFKFDAKENAPKTYGDGTCLHDSTDWLVFGLQSSDVGVVFRSIFMSNGGVYA